MAIEESHRQRARIYGALSEPHRLAILDALRLSDRTPGELAATLDLPMNLLSFHLAALEDVGLVERHRSSGDGRRRYVRALVEPLDEAVAALTAGAPDVGPAERVLFVCSHNAARSQLAAALWLGRTGRPAQSAGQAPARAVHPLAVAVAASRGVDLSAMVPRGLDAVSDVPDLVVTVCDRALESGRPFPQVPHLHWSIDDPVADGRPAAFARAYDDVAVRIEDLAERVAA